MKSGKIDVTVESGSMEKKKFSFSSLPASIELPMGVFVLAFAPSEKALSPYFLLKVVVPEIV